LERVAEISFEFFPPKSEEQAAALTATAKRLAVHRPAFVSITYGANGSTRERSFAAVRAVREATGTAVAAHVTCVGAPRASVEGVADAYYRDGVRRFVALRGDPEGGAGAAYRPHPGGFQTTACLVAHLKALGGTDVSVSAYPERHPESRDWDTELDVLRAKVDAGADRALTQFFFDVDAFLDYRDRVARAGIDIPIVPGIMPIHRFAAVRSFAARCGTLVPDALAARFEGVADDEAGTQALAVEIGAGQIACLAAEGVTAFHIYTLNRAELASAILDRLGASFRRAGPRQPVKSDEAEQHRAHEGDGQ